MCLRVSPKAIASAFKSFHSLLTLNTEYGGQRRIVLATIITPQKPPCLFFSIFSAFRRRPQRQRPLLTDVVVLEFISRRDAETQRLKSQKFFRVFSYHFVVPNSPQKPPCLFFSIFSAFRQRPQRQRPLLTDVVVLDFISRRDAETQRLKPR